MSLSIGIVGLPNVGKSTTFNALTGAQRAAVANYPFCTIQPNHAIVPLPDTRLDELGKLTHVPNVIHSTVEFMDIAGLVAGASKGEGLGNQFLAQIRDVSAIIHIVRCFEDPNIVHVSEKPMPADDMATIEVELALADLEQVQRKLQRLESDIKADKKLLAVQTLTKSLYDHLASGSPASSFPDQKNDIFQVLNQELRFLTAKPVIYLINVDEEGLTTKSTCVQEIEQIANQRNIKTIQLCAQLEQDLTDMNNDERKEYLALAGIKESGLEQVIRASFEMLDLISFFTYNQNEARAWNIPRGTTAPKAAGEIHTDFERGFIRAEVIPFDIFQAYGDAVEVKAAGKMQLEGKDYLVQDGDVIYFRFNV
jgi:ribosome-binding ATPase